MKILSLSLLSALSLSPLVVELGPSPGGVLQQDGGQDVSQRVAVHRGSFARKVTLEGRFVPGEATEIDLWTQAYAGEFLWLEVPPHGNYLNKGDVVARISTRAIDEQIGDAQLELHASQTAHDAAVTQAQIDAEAAAAREGQARANLARAQRDLAGHREFQVSFQLRRDELTASRIQDGIDDQEDELAQLEAMYRDDELVEATEEIVLRRSRRALARTRSNQKLAQDGLVYEAAFTRKSAAERLEEAVQSQEGELGRLLRSMSLSEGQRAMGLLRSAHTLGKQRKRHEQLLTDRQLLVLKAPRSGVLLHGGLSSYDPGKAHPTHVRGGQAARRKALFTVIDPDRLAVAADVSESMLADAQQGMSVRIKPILSGTRESVGVLHLERYPSAASAAGPDNKYLARIELDQPVAGIVVGMRAQLELVTEALEDVLVLPASAVREEGGLHCWAASASGTFERVTLELGPASDGDVVVYGPLRKGQQVLLGKAE